MNTLEIEEYTTAEEKSPFGQWFDKLSPQAAVKVTSYITRVGEGNFSQLKKLRDGVYELRIDWGPGYRVYLGKVGDKLVILLGGGTKKRQQNDIEQAILRWKDYKKRIKG